MDLIVSVPEFPYLLFDMSSAEDFTHSAKRSLSDRYRLEGMQQCNSLH